MKIVFDLTALADNYSGIERYAHCISSAFIQSYSQHDYVLLFKEKVHETYHEIAQMPNVKCVVLTRRNKLLFNQVILPWELYKQTADAYFFLAFPDPIFFFGKKVYTALHDACCWDCGDTMTTMSKWYFRFSQLHSMFFCRKIITISDFSKRRIQSIGKVKDERIEIVYCGIGEQFNAISKNDRAVLKRYNLPDEYMLTLSTLEPRKNLPLLLDAYAQLIDAGEQLLPLVLAGRKGWKIDNLLSRYSADVCKKLHFTGFVADEDLPAMYRGAKWFIFPTRYEGFGIPPLEAMACGTPVISSDAASMPEVLGDVPLYFESENREALVQQLLKAKSFSNEEWLNMSKTGIEHAAKYNWTNEARKISFFV